MTDPSDMHVPIFCNERSQDRSHPLHGSKVKLSYVVFSEIVSKHGNIKIRIFKSRIQLPSFFNIKQCTELIREHILGRRSNERASIMNCPRTLFANNLLRQISVHRNNINRNTLTKCQRSIHNGTRCRTIRIRQGLDLRT